MTSNQVAVLLTLIKNNLKNEFYLDFRNSFDSFFDKQTDIKGIPLLNFNSKIDKCFDEIISIFFNED